MNMVIADTWNVCLYAYNTILMSGRFNIKISVYVNPKCLSKGEIWG